MKYLLVLIVLAFAAIELWRQVRRIFLRGAAGTGARGKLAQPTVSCALCGVHIPQHEAFYRAGHPYCCVQHARNAKQEAPAGASFVDPHEQRQP